MILNEYQREDNMVLRIPANFPGNLDIILLGLAGNGGSLEYYVCIQHSGYDISHPKYVATFLPDQDRKLPPRVGIHTCEFHLHESCEGVFHYATILMAPTPKQDFKDYSKAILETLNKEKGGLTDEFI